MNQYQQMKSLCQQYLNQPVNMQVHGQHLYNGVVEYVDDENVYVMVPIDDQGQHMDLKELIATPGAFDTTESEHIPGEFSEQQMRGNEDARFFPGGYGGYGYPGYGFYPGYGYPGYGPFYPYPRPRFRGWGRVILPLAALTAIAALY
ncbi:hypothetical protein [Bacillus solitudinis]|uniref:hypothetical protein n=1 Tax=Bacillus solitudinis TaxID=2014074 RepID=UPI000C247D20|nr:hypothetical protein [Bacillus solitudinis]